MEQGANDLHVDPADATVTPSSLASLTSRWFNLSAADLPGCPRKEIIKGVSFQGNLW